MIKITALNKNGTWLDLTEPMYQKRDGVYGYLCVSNRKVYFFGEGDGIFFEDVTEEFELIYK